LVWFLTKNFPISLLTVVVVTGLGLRFFRAAAVASCGSAEGREDSDAA